MKYSGAAAALGMTGISSVQCNSMKKSIEPVTIKIKDVSSDFEREPLIPYHFKGSSITQAWQSLSWMQSESGLSSVGIGTQGVLWSDSKTFHGHSENGGNALMYAMTERALQMIKGESFKSPVELLDNILPEVWEYGKKITRNPDLRKTFALNALVGIDNAAWLLYVQENNIATFDDMIPEAYQHGLSHHHDKVASIPSYSVGTKVDVLKKAAEEGYFIMKLKTGSSGTQAEMLEKDILFMTELHKTIGHFETPYTKSGKIPYYFDANGRYEKMETLERFLDAAKKVGAFDQIAVIEEPFDEYNESFVGDLGVRIAADESAHAVEDAARRIEQGYNTMAVKAIAKTLSMTMQITQLAYEHQVPCFCADLTVNPILVDWNKSVAARLPPFPELDLGLQETNGHQYYINWDQMMQYHPMAGAEWTKTVDGVYATGKEFYEKSAGILTPSQHYTDIFKRVRPE